MNIWEVLNSALRNLLRAKVRSFLTMLGIIIGVGAVIGMLSIGEGARQQVTARIEALGSNLLMVHHWHSSRHGEVRIQTNPQDLTYEDGLAILDECPAVKNVAPELRQSFRVTFEGSNWDSRLYGTGASYQEVKNFHVETGRFLDVEDVELWRSVCVLGKTVKDSLFGEIDPMGKMIKVERTRFTVIGVMEEKGQVGWENLDDQIFVPITAAQKRFSGSERVDGLLCQAVSAESATEAEAQIRAVLLRRHGGEDFRVRSQLEFLQTATQTTQTFKFLLGSIALIALLVGGIGIMNIMLVSVTERTREIGIRKAVGAKKRDIMLQFLVESVVICLIGGTVGILLGIGLGTGAGVAISKAMPGDSPWQSIVTLTSVFVSFGFAAGVGIFFGIYPANKASKLDPVEAMRHE